MNKQAIPQQLGFGEGSATPMWRAGLDGRCTYFNPSWLAFRGRSLGDEAGSGWTEGVHPADAARVVHAYRDGIRRREPFEIHHRLRRADGAYRHVVVRVVPYPDAAGRAAGFVGTCLDVTDDDMLRAPSATEEFFDMSLDHLCVAGLDGYFKRVNPSWARTLGWTIEELLSRPNIELVHPDDRERTLAGRGVLKDGREMGPLTNRYLCKDGTHRWFEWRSVADRERGLVYAAARDITEQKASEERLEQAKQLQDDLQRQLIFADRMASVGTLAAGVAHEINNPLAYVAGNLDLLAEELRAGAPAIDAGRLARLQKMAADAQAGAERIRKIVRGLRTFSRAEEERRTAVDLLPLLDLSADMTMNEIRQRARLVKEYGAVPHVDGDDARLGQVFINLLVNAAQAIPEGDSAGNEIRIATSTDARGRAVVEIRDTGVGIPAHLVDRIFEPFFTTKPIGVGTGLGLSICHNIVQAFRGDIGVTSQEGRGTTFRVELPAATRPSADPRERLVPPPATGDVAAATILVVDDEPAIGALMQRALRQHGVTVVETGTAALELLGAGRQFDVILSDLMMPEMSGMELYAALARRHPEAAARVIFISGGAFTPAAKAFLDRVSNPHVDKPLDPRYLRELIQALLRERGRISAGRPIVG